MTIKEAQELIEAWVGKHPSRYRSELTNMAVLTEEVGELARVIARKHGDPSQSQEKLKADMANELGVVMWVLLHLASQSGIDLTEALIENLDKKNLLDLAARREAERPKGKPKK